MIKKSELRNKKSLLTNMNECENIYFLSEKKYDKYLNIEANKYINFTCIIEHSCISHYVYHNICILIIKFEHEI